MSVPIRAGILGYGFAGRGFHAYLLTHEPRIGLHAVATRDPVRRERAARDYGCRTYATLDELLADDEVDLVIIATPHHVHAQQAVAVMNAGKHCVCDKVMCLTSEEAAAMLAARDRNQVLLSIFHNRRWDGDFLTIRRALADGLIGTLRLLEIGIWRYGAPRSWRGEKAAVGSIMHDWGAHFVDWILNLLPGPVESVTGIFHKRLWHDVTNEDQGQAILRFAGGRIAELQISSIAAVARPKWRILGTQGGLIGEWDKPLQVVSYVNGRREERSVPTAKSRWDAYYYNVADHLLSGEPLAVTAESARRVIAVLEAATRSGESGRSEEVAGEG